jgi:hypothetical protein
MLFFLPIRCLVTTEGYTCREIDGRYLWSAAFRYDHVPWYTSTYQMSGIQKLILGIYGEEDRISLLRESLWPALLGSAALLLGLGLSFGFLTTYTIGKTSWKGGQPDARPLPTHTTTQTQNKHTHKHPCLQWHSNPRSVLERAKTVHSLDRAATVIDRAADQQGEIYE